MLGHLVLDSMSHRAVQSRRAHTYQRPPTRQLFDSQLYRRAVRISCSHRYQRSAIPVLDSMYHRAVQSRRAHTYQRPPMPDLDSMWYRFAAPKTICTADQFQTVAATGSSDQQCQTLTACTADQSEGGAPTSTSDRQCQTLTKQWHLQILATATASP